MSYLKEKIKTISMVSVLVISVLFLLYITCFNDFKVKAKILDKYNKTVVRDGNSSTTYIIITDNGIYSSTVNILRGKLSAEIIYSQLVVGETYELTCIGIDAAFIGLYPNIIDAY